MNHFDRWFEHHTSIIFKNILEKELLKDLATLEGQMLDWAVALGGRTFIDFQLRESIMRLIILHRNTKFDSTSHTAPDDIAVIL